jgi:adenosylhomocysteine nucleosidase
MREIMQRHHQTSFMDVTMTTTRLRLGIISALEQEQTGLIENMTRTSTITRGRRDYVSGNLWGIDAVCVLSRLGKVAAATTAATLIERFDVTHVVFTGVAGAADAKVRVGDIVVADHLMQHDMDASPLFPRFEIPLTGQSRLRSDKFLSDLLEKSATSFAKNDFFVEIAPVDRHSFKLDRPRVHRGLIASGDEFINCRTRLSDLKGELAEVLAVEMEGAAVAQVCSDYQTPFAVIRTISDNANEDAPVDFTRFVDRVASRYAYSIVRRLCMNE